MNAIINGLVVTSKRKDSMWIIVIATLLFILGFILFQNLTAATSVLQLTMLSPLSRGKLFFSTLFDLRGNASVSTLLLVFVGSLLAGINISFAYTYMKIRGEMLVKSGFYTGMGLFLALLGIGCAACGTALLSLILSFFGASAVLQLLPYHGEEIGYIGLLILLVGTYFLAKKLTSPNVC